MFNPKDCSLVDLEEVWWKHLEHNKVQNKAVEGGLVMEMESN